MAIRKLTKAQQHEIVHAFKSGNFELKELGDYYGVSHTTIRNVLVDHKVLEGVARKTPEQQAMLEHLKMLNITEVSQLRSVLRDVSRSSAQRLYNSLTLQERTEWFTQSVLTSNNTTVPEEALFTSQYLEGNHETIKHPKA